MEKQAAKELLLLRKKELEAKLAQLQSVKAGEEGEKMQVDEIGDEAQESINFHTNQEAEGVYNGRLELIDLALKDLEKERYGICNMCEQMISDKRLRNTPEAQYCISCQEKIEK